MHETLELIERTRRRLADRDLPLQVAGGVTEAAVDAAEEALGTPLPPSYRAFLRKYGAIALPARLSTIHQFVGLSKDGARDKGVVARTLDARVENRLASGLVIVGLGAETGEWYCLDVGRVRADGECPIFLFDARDNQLDQQFYDDFGSMLHEVMSFLDETLDEAGDLAAGDGDAAVADAY